MEWRASHILVKDKRFADELLRRIKQGAGFEAACKRLGNGSLSDVVSTRFGHHIIKLTGRKD